MSGTSLREKKRKGRGLERLPVRLCVFEAPAAPLYLLSSGFLALLIRWGHNGAGAEFSCDKIVMA